MQNGDILQIKDFQNLANVEGEILNVYYYRVGGLSTSVPIEGIAAEFASAWATEITALMTPVQANTLTHVKLEVNNLMDYEGDYFSYTYPSPVAGQAAGGYSASGVAWSIQLVRTNRSTRHGSKRIAGVPDNQLDNNVAAGLILPFLTALATGLGSNAFLDIVGYPDFELEPVILKSPVLTATPPLVINPVSAGAYRGVGSQSSRKQLLS